MINNQDEDREKYLAKQIDQKIDIAVKCSLFKMIKSQGNIWEAAQNLQDLYIMKNQENIPPSDIHPYLKARQEVLMEKLKKVLPSQPGSTGINQASENLSPDISQCYDENNTLTDKDLKTSTAIKQQQIPFKKDEHYLRDVRFLKSIILLTEECNNPTISTSRLHSLLYDETDFTSQVQSANHSTVCGKNQMTEDSGVGYSEGFSEENPIATRVASNVVKNILSHTNASNIVTVTSRDVINYVRERIAKDVEGIFYEWKGSIMEHIVNALRQCSKVNSGCRELLINYIAEVLGECWNDHRSYAHILNEKKLLIIEQLIGDVETCYEVLQNISEKMDMFHTYITKKHRDVPILVGCVSLLLDLYRKTCDIARELKSKNGSSSEKKSKPKELLVTDIWLEQWWPTDSDCDSLQTPIEDRDIAIFERLLLSDSKYVSNNTKIIEALRAVRYLKNVNNST